MKEPRKIWRRPNKDNKQFPSWFCMTLSDAQSLWLSFSCYLWRHVCIIYRLELFPFLKSDPQQCCFSPAKKGLQQPQSLCAHSYYWLPRNWNMALQGEDNTTTYGSGSQRIAWVGFTGLKKDVLAWGHQFYRSALHHLLIYKVSKNKIREVN